MSHSAEIRRQQKDRDKERRGDGRGDEREGVQEEEESSDENLDIEINSEDSDEDAIIERKRKERAELLAKLAAGGPTEAMQHREKVKKYFNDNLYHFSKSTPHHQILSFKDHSIQR